MYYKKSNNVKNVYKLLRTVFFLRFVLNNKNDRIARNTMIQIMIVFVLEYYMQLIYKIRVNIKTEPGLEYIRNQTSAMLSSFLQSGSANVYQYFQQHNEKHCLKRRSCYGGVETPNKKQISSFGRISKLLEQKKDRSNK